MAKRADLSLLFDLFVTSQRVRRVLSDGLAEAGMRPDEYAVYGLLFERSPITATEMAVVLGMPLTTVLDYLKAMTTAGHLQRSRHPVDGRALELSLSRAGVAAHKRANTHWEVVRKRIEAGLSMPISDIRVALHALDDAADKAGESARPEDTKVPRSSVVAPTWRLKAPARGASVTRSRRLSRRQLQKSHR